MSSQAPTQDNVPSTHPYTCNTCQVAFRSSDFQRAHMQTDWHRYNLKRRVAELPPLSSEIFTEKVLANRASAAATAAKASFEKSCQICQKTYYSENAYSNHLNSQKHKTNVAKAGRNGHLDDSASVTGSVMSSTFSLGEPMADSEADRDAEKEFSKVVDGINSTTLEDGDETDPVSRRPTRPHHSAAEDKPSHPLSRASTTAPAEEDDKTSVASSNKVKPDPKTDCLFCNYRSPNFSLSVNHMVRIHGMFIPEKDFLVDLEGLIQYLYAKIQDKHACLKCGKVTHTAEGTQTHMRDRGHCMIGFESDEELVEVGEFYDFSSTYSDAEDFDDFEREANESDNSTSAADGGVKLGAKLGKRRAARKTQDGAKSGDEEEDQGWETDSTVSSVPTDEITSVPIEDRSHMYKKLPLSRHHSHNDPRPHRSADGFHSHAHPTPVAVYHDEYELHLPSGRTAGHRSLNKYYRQNLRNYPGVAERMEAQQRKLTQGEEDSDGDVDMEDDGGRGRRQLATRANGGTGMIGVNDFKKAEIRAIEKKDRKREQHHRNKVLARVEKQNNSQKHFRDPLLQ